MSAPTADAVRDVLSHVATPGGGADIISTGTVRQVSVLDGKVSFVLEIDPKFASLYEPVRAEAEGLVKAMPGVTQVNAVLTAHSDAPAPSAQQARSPQKQPHRHGDDGRGRPQNPGRAGKHGAPPPPTPEAIPGIKHIVAVASGKGGVGKSTVAVNLAVALSQAGLKVGLLDADIYGPSLPTMMGVTGKPESDGKVLQPLEAFGLKVMSMGMLVPGDSPMIWRGPMVNSALTQMLQDVAWAPLDVLVVDMPPGTGDAQLTLVQRVPVTGAVIVSTPQEIALIDARKGLAMFEKVNVPVLGIVENMSWLEMPDGSRNFIFGEGGAKRTAEKLGCPFLGEVPLISEIRQTADEGTPIVAHAPQSAAAKVFIEIAKKVSDALERV